MISLLLTSGLGSATTTELTGMIDILSKSAVFGPRRLEDISMPTVSRCDSSNGDSNVFGYMFERDLGTIVIT